ncbi:type 2 isopentenyl-diphosphate Delta-isomerase [Tardisphaera miroshnichenkoae]
MQDVGGTEARKKDHIRIALTSDVVPQRFRSQFDQVVLVHEALPSIGIDDVNTSTLVFGKKLEAPIIVGAMTGGAPGTDVINGNIAEAVEEAGLGMGVGSQRAALMESSLEYTFRVIRRKAPGALVLANLGASNARKMSVAELKRAVEMVEADALEIHLNMLQELLQPEGEPNFRGLEEGLDSICDEVGVPVLIKETGSGISRDTALRLKGKKLAGFDVGGAGGTSFALIEGRRRSDNMAEAFSDWGIPTVASVMEIRSVSDKLIVASGGLRNGVDAAKSIAIGANLASFARPLLRPAAKSPQDVKGFLDQVKLQLKMTMVLTNSRDLQALMKVPYVLFGDMAAWAEQRGLASRAR